MPRETASWNIISFCIDAGGQPVANARAARGAQSEERAGYARVMRRWPLTLVLVLLGASACREADLTAVRADLVTQAAMVCAAPPVRPAHAPKTRELQPAEVSAAIATLCTEEAARQAASAPPLAVLHEALAQDRAITGDLRRSRLLIDAPRIDLGAVKGAPEGMRTAEEALANASAGSRCGPAWTGLERFMLAAATAQAKAGHAAEALEVCADVVALARDEAVTGGMTELLLSNTNLQRAYTACTPIVDAAPKEAAAKLAASLAVLRPTFPSTLEDVLRRDHAEVLLFTFGRVREAARPLPCERAIAIAAASDHLPPLTRGERLELLRAWNEANAEVSPPDEKYTEAYSLTLRVLDKLTEHAKSR